jgi:hypothetical protein
MESDSVTVLLPFLAYFRAIGDESGGERTKVFVAQVEGKTRTSLVLLAFWIWPFVIPPLSASYLQLQLF